MQHLKGVIANTNKRNLFLFIHDLIVFYRIHVTVRLITFNSPFWNPWGNSQAALVFQELNHSVVVPCIHLLQQQQQQHYNNNITTTRWHDFPSPKYYKRENITSRLTKLTFQCNLMYHHDVVTKWASLHFFPACNTYNLLVWILHARRLVAHHLFSLLAVIHAWKPLWRSGSCPLRKFPRNFRVVVSPPICPAHFGVGLLCQ